MNFNLKKFLNNFEEYLAGILLLLMVTIAFINVVSRFTFKFSISYIEELEVYLYVWLVMLGSAIAFKRLSHLCVSLVVDKMPPSLRKYIKIFVTLLSIGFFSVIFKSSITQIQDEILMQVTTTSMGVPKWWYTLGLPIGSGLIIIRLLQRLFKRSSGE
jgi:TRAP-type C4-dicarboxylate transport system permease small subunit